ncbi:MAG TPA: helicase-related protein, partial [Nitrososphaeraceae archaeon]
MSLNKESPYFIHPLLMKNNLKFREYQNMIANSAMTKNTLVILPTALGKTIISLLVSINALYKNRDKRILILAPTRPLVNQHRDSFVSSIKLFDDQVAMLTGKIQPHARTIVWNKESIRLVFSTPELVKNDILERRLSLKDFTLIVFDEAHRAVKDYAYTFIAKQYLQDCSCPVILGLTASPGSEINKIQEICDNLFIERLDYKTEEDADVRRYINRIDLNWTWFDLPSEYQYIRSILKTMLDERLNWLVTKNMIKKNSKWIYKRDLISLGKQLRQNLDSMLGDERRSLFLAIMQQSVGLSLMYCIELMESQGFYSLETFLNRKKIEDSKSHRMLLSDNRMKEVNRLIEQLKIEHPKIEYLIKILKVRFDSQFNLNRNSNLADSVLGKNSRVLVFTQYRDTVQHLVELLNKNKMKASGFVGQSDRQGVPGMKQEEQRIILENFKKGDFNVLVATSIAEEGLDIPEVDLVIFYEPIPSEIRHIQRRGRTGRKNTGSVLILATKDTIDQRYLEISRKKIQKMNSILSSISTNLKLKPVHRDHLKKNPMTKYEIDYLDSFFDKVQRGTKIASLSSKNKKSVSYRIPHSKNDQAIVHFKRQVEQTARKIYSVVSIKGNKGLTFETIENILGVDEPLITAALKLLEKLGKIKTIGNNVIFSKTRAKIRGQIFNIEVEKVAIGKAIVLVNGKWRANLYHYEYG